MATPADTQGQPAHHETRGAAQGTAEARPDRTLDPDDALEKAIGQLRSVAGRDQEELTVQPAAPGAGGMSRTLREIPLEVQAVIGRTEMSVAQLNGLRKGATVPLNSRVGEPVDIMVNGVKVATGQMQLSEDDPDRFAFKVISVCQ
ncbi:MULTISPECIES: FliM/FliN family flagellar motor switch protein [unclassified Roseitalea]|uniref:FliM/FliN family flagellar motor switch protein n=1 Tax=unclassified Roseitalea TaxID=2639107 RepID=UPI00273E00FD|nr:MULTISPECIES: FliM/FliN family flagellar motor switch protein [unclassified Roseitalea]